MITNDDILQELNKLQETYNNLTAELLWLKEKGYKTLSLYKNAFTFWDGKNNLTTSDSLWNSVIPVGTTTKGLYGNWNNRFMITITNAIANSPDGIPANFIKIKVPMQNITDGTFFILTPEADSCGYGIKTCWIINPVSGLPETLLGCNCCDKYDNIGNSLQISPTNNTAMVNRYHQWLAYNFTKEQLETAVDSDGNVSFAVCSTVATWYISGWAIAERNTKVNITTGKIISDGLYGSSGNKPAYNSMFSGLYLFKFVVNTTYNEFRLPYQAADDGLILGFLHNADYYTVEPELFGAVTEVALQNRFTANCVSNYSRIFNQLNLPQWSVTEICLTADEVLRNTITINGLKLLRLKLSVPPNNRDVFFGGLFTEEK